MHQRNIKAFLSASPCFVDGVQVDHQARPHSMASCISFLLQRGRFNMCATAGGDGQEGTPKVTCGWQNAKPPGAGRHLWHASLQRRGARVEGRERAATSMKGTVRWTDGEKKREEGVYLRQELRPIPFAKNNRSILFSLSWMHELGKVQWSSPDPGGAGCPQRHGVVEPITSQTQPCCLHAPWQKAKPGQGS